jgi:hypothetical protein
LFAQYQNDILTRIIRSFEKSKRRAIDSGSLVKAGELLLDRRATLVGLIQELDEILRDICSAFLLLGLLTRTFSS